MKHTHGARVKCPKCDFEAKNELELTEHDRSKHASNEYDCTECGKQFRFYHQLRMHMAHHALHAIYSCKVCGEEFKRKNDLRNHTKESSCLVTLPLS